MKLSKEQLKQRDDLVEKLRDLEFKVESAVDEFNEVAAEHFFKITEALSEYEAIVGEAEQFRSDIESEAQSLYDERSEKWQEGEKGQALGEFINDWGQCLSEPEQMESPTVECPELNASSELEGMPSESSS